MKTLQDYKNELLANIEALKAEAAAMPFTLEESQQASEEISRLVGLVMAGEIKINPLGEEMGALFEKARKFDNLKTAESFEETLNLDLVLLTEKYLITDARDILSPAGFHPETMITVKSAVFIQCNKLPRALGGNLRAFDLDKLRASYGVTRNAA